jgi:3-isopropylmalate/(R)-2-methylmalate dehydratase small subunit
MMMQPFSMISSRVVVLDVDDVDTDQIIPARFLTTTSRSGLGAHLFADWRFDAHGTPRPQFVLNHPDAAGAQILIAGRNFGCGSSREHAPWALADFGFRAVIATSFGDIFKGNALKVGLLPITIQDTEHRALMSAWTRDPALELTVDLEAQRLCSADVTWSFPIDPFAKRCLLEGVDELGFLLSVHDQILAYERAHAAPIAGASSVEARA